MEDSNEIIEIDKMSVDQFAGAVVLILGAIGSLLLVIWQSKCHCKVNLCYVFQCERRPPNEEELKTLADETKALKNKRSNKSKKIENEEEVVTPRLTPKKTESRHQEVLQKEPEPQQEVIP